MSHDPHVDTDTGAKRGLRSSPSDEILQHVYGRAREPPCAVKSDHLSLSWLVTPLPQLDSEGKGKKNLKLEGGMR